MHGFNDWNRAYFFIILLNRQFLNLISNLHLIFFLFCQYDCIFILNNVIKLKCLFIKKIKAKDYHSSKALIRKD